MGKHFEMLRAHQPYSKLIKISLSEVDDMGSNPLKKRRKLNLGLNLCFLHIRTSGKFPFGPFWS